MNKKSISSWWVYASLCIVIIILASNYPLAVQPDPQINIDSKKEAIHHFQMGTTYRNQGDLRAAILEFQKVLAAPTFDDQFLMNQVQAATQLINLYPRIGKTDEVERTLKAIDLKLDGKIRPSAIFYNQLALYYERYHQLEKAKKYNQQALDWLGKLDQDREVQRIEALIYFCFGKIHQREGHKPQAIEAFRKVVEAPTFDQPVLTRQIDSIFRLINIYSDLGRQGEINKLIQDGIRKVQGNRTAINFYYRLSHYYEGIQQPEHVTKYDQKIIELAEELLHKEGTDAETLGWKTSAHFALGKVYQRQGNIEQAIREFNTVVEMPVPGPPFVTRYAEAANSLIYLYEKLDKRDEIERLIPKVIQKLEKRPRALAALHFNASAYYARNHRRQEAKKHGQQALNMIGRVQKDNRIQRIEALTYLNLAKVYEEEGDQAHQIEALHKVVSAPALGPFFLNRQIDALLQLISIYNQSGKKDATEKLIRAHAKKVEEELHKSKKGPMKSEAMKAAGRFYFAAGDHYKQSNQSKEAKYYYEKVIKLNQQLSEK